MGFDGAQRWQVEPADGLRQERRLHEEIPIRATHAVLQIEDVTARKRLALSADLRRRGNSKAHCTLSSPPTPEADPNTAYRIVQMKFVCGVVV